MINQPTAAEFIARYSLFTNVPATTIDAILEEAMTQVTDRWIVKDQKPAVMAYAAHILSMEGYDKTIPGGGPDGGDIMTTGPVQAVQVGDVRTIFARASDASAAAGGASSPSSYTAWLGQSAYGLQFLALRRRNFMGPTVT